LSGSGLTGSRALFHRLFGRHTADLQASHWMYGQFVSTCTRCACAMVKPPGQEWQER
jgi:hypothetical protein